MNDITLTTRIVLRGDTAESWRLADPVLLAGEPGAETDTGRLKLGDGQTPWSALAYAQGVPARLEAGAPADGTTGTPGALWLDTQNGRVYLNCADGPAAWQRLVLGTELAELGAGDMEKSLFASGEKAAQGYVDRAVLADGLTEPLTTTSVAEDGQLYFTQVRAEAVFDTRVAQTPVSALADGAQVLLAGEEFVLDGGGAGAEVAM